MKRAIFCFSLVVSFAALPVPGNALIQTNDGFDAFWQKFKTAVTRVDKETVVSLTGFPMRMPGRVRNLKDAADLRLRYRDVFNKYASAAKCFANETPIEDPNNRKQYVVSCFDNKGSAIDYIFARDKSGWKFVRLDKYDLPD
jgi:hypothetical protein